MFARPEAKVNPIFMHIKELYELCTVFYAVFFCFLHVQPDNKLKCRSVLSTLVPSLSLSLSRFRWGGGAAAQWGNVWTKCTASLEDANKFFLCFSACLFCFHYFCSLLSLQLPTLCLKCCWQTTWKCVCVVCAVCVVCPLTYFIRKASDKSAPPLPAALHTLHSCRNYAASKWVEKLGTGGKTQRSRKRKG